MTPHEQAVTIVSQVLITPVPVIDSMSGSRQFAYLVVAALEDAGLMQYGRSDAQPQP